MIKKIKYLKKGLSIKHYFTYDELKILKEKDLINLIPPLLVANIIMEIKKLECEKE